MVVGEIINSLGKDGKLYNAATLSGGETRETVHVQLLNLWGKTTNYSVYNTCSDKVVRRGNYMCHYYVCA